MGTAVMLEQSSASVPVLPLPAAFARAQDAVDAHTKGGGEGAYERALQSVRDCQALVDAHALFSANEDHDDIPTRHLRFLLLPSMLGELLAGSRARDVAARACAVTEALAAFERLLQRCDQYGLAPEPVRAALRAAEGGGAPDPAARRTAKLERHQRALAVRGRLQQLRQQQGRLQGRGADEADEAGREVGPVGGPGGWDEEDERALWVTQIEASCLAAVDQLDLLRQEQQLLAHAAGAGAAAPPRGADDRRARAAGTAAGEDGGSAAVREAMRARLAGIAAQLSGSERQRMQAQVFRPSHTLPTMSIEQLAQQEVAEARERQEREAAAQAAHQRREQDRRSDGSDEEEVQRERAWDDFKDDNPRGWGNSKLRPCG